MIRTYPDLSCGHVRIVLYDPTARRLGFKGARKYIHLGLAVAPAEFDATGRKARNKWVASTHPFAGPYNRLIESTLQLAQSIAIDMAEAAKAYTLDDLVAQVKERLNPVASKPVNGFLSWFEQTVKQVGQSSPAQAYKMQIEVIRLTNQLGHPPSIETFCPGWAQQYFTVLVKQCVTISTRQKAKPMDHNSAGKAMSVWKTIHNLAVGDGIMSADQNARAWNRYKFTKKTKDYFAMSMEDIRSWAQVECKPGSNQEYARDAILFLIYCQGARISDLVSAKVRQIETKQTATGELEVCFTYRMKKVNDKPMRVLLTGHGAMLALKWCEGVQDPDTCLLPLQRPGARQRRITEARNTGSRSVNQIINNECDSLAKAAGIKGKVRCHTARRTVGDMAADAGDILLTKSVLGHSSVAVSMQYTQRGKDQKRKDDFSRDTLARLIESPELEGHMQGTDIPKDTKPL